MSKSCGCLQPAPHGHASNGVVSPEYVVWACMKRRCLDDRLPAFRNYGGRGIQVCERWADFRNFYADMGPKPSPRHSIDRIDNDGNYEPGNCRWATRGEQCNNRRGNRRITVGDRTMTIAQWSRATGLPPGTLVRRLDLGWSHERAVTAPPRRWADRSAEPRSELGE